LATNDEQLVRSYLEKQQANKTPTAAEAKAYQRVVDARILTQLRTTTPDFFNQLFGVQNKQRYDWEDRCEFPCGRGRKTIDVIAVLVAIKNLIAANRKYLGIDSTPTGNTLGSDADIDINEAKHLKWNRSMN